jgi:acylphosphatase
MTHNNITAGSVIEMVKKRIIVKGNVQGAGFRALVKKIARSMGIKGRVQNLDDGTVEIYCEAEEDILIRFVKAIDIRQKDGNLLAIDVQEMKIYLDGSDGYSKKDAMEPFTSFEIDYRQDLTVAEKESLERQELLIVGGSQVSDRLEVVGQKVDGVGQDVRAMHSDMNVRFEGLDKKYHVIGEHLLETSQNIAGMNENIAHMNENNAKMNDNIAKMNEDLSVIARALLKLVESNIKKNGRRAKKAKG